MRSLPGIVTKFHLVICVFLFSQFAFGQDSLLLSFDEYRTLVRSNHPYSKQANLQLLRGESAVRRARGGFDPRLSASFDNKNYEGKDYYNLTHAQLKIPTAAAVELKAGFDLNSGQYLNETDVTPDEGLVTAGLSLPLLQGLLMDERRTALRQARAFNEFSKYEQEILINDLLLAAYNAYWEWWSSYEKKKIASDILRVATDRFDAVKQRAIAGQAPIIDTVEANIQKLLRLQQLRDAEVNEIKMRMALSSFVWDESNAELIPRIINPKFFPSDSYLNNGNGDYILQNFLLLADSIAYFNPYLRQYTARLAGIEAEERMKREKLKPKLNLNYNLLAEPVGTTDANFSTENYKWGMDFSFPLLLRTERGDLQLTRIKLQETKLDQIQQTQQVKNKANAAYQNIFLLRQQVSIATANVDNYALLLEGERTKFFNGESSLFLVNQRELQYADAQNKLIDLKAKLNMLSNELSFLLGLIE